MATMVKVRKANVVLHIKETEVKRYLDLGYDVIDDGGDIVQKSIPNDIVTLKNAYLQHTAEIEKLNAEVQRLNNLLKAKKAEPKKLKTE